VQLYRLSTIVLDSYPAGGCTTTREALELNKAVVTLPARFLGGRWTLGYYNVIGLDEEVKHALIASTPEEYIKLAVALGTNETLRRKTEASIERAVPNLFGRTEAVEEWQRILLNASPVKICGDNHDEL
jgi:protein O-GlcNAc transferase